MALLLLASIPGTSLDTDFTFSACDGWGNRSAIATYTFTARSASAPDPVIVASGAACSATAQLPPGDPVAVAACVQDAYRGITCRNATATVTASVSTIARLEGKLTWLAGLQGSAAQAGAALLLLQAAASLSDPAERMRYKDRLWGVLQDLDTCGGGMGSAADVQVRGWA